MSTLSVSGWLERPHEERSARELFVYGESVLPNRMPPLFVS